MSILKKIKENKFIKESIKGTKEPVEFISTGCKSIDILFSGKLAGGGIARNRISTIAAPSSLGKSFIAYKTCQNAVEAGMEIVYIDSEEAHSEKLANSLGLTEDNFLCYSTNKIEDAQRFIVNVFKDMPAEDKNKILLVIDSWGGFITSKTYDDAVSGKDVTDMTAAKKRNSLARIITGIGVTTFVVAQTYETMDMFNPLQIGGGKGIIFASSAIVLGKTKAKVKNTKDASDIVGTVISAETKKSRFSKENTKLKYRINYDTGIDKWFGILDIAIEGGYVLKPSNGYYTRAHIDGDKKHRESEIWNMGDEFWNPILEDTDFAQYVEERYSF